jgi:hypothetical protein
MYYCEIESTEGGAAGEENDGKEEVFRRFCSAFRGTSNQII